jgi:hypothetical protein
MGTTLMPQIGNEQRDAKEKTSERCVKDKQNRILKATSSLSPDSLSYCILYFVTPYVQLRTKIERNIDSTIDTWWHTVH